MVSRPNGSIHQKKGTIIKNAIGRQSGLEPPPMAFANVLPLNYKRLKSFNHYA